MENCYPTDVIIVLYCQVWGLGVGSLLLGLSQLVIALRLIMSGDVELNPGPLDAGMCMLTV